MADHLFRPGEPCLHPGCGGRMVIERHITGCDCLPWREPCRVCADATADVAAAGANPGRAGASPRPWIICDACDWMEADGGLSAHQRLAALARARTRGEG